MGELRWTLPATMEQWSVEQPDVENFTFVNRHGTHSVWKARDIYRTASRFAWRLHEDYGFVQGDVIANGVPNSPERLITDLGIILAGCVMVNCQVIEKDGSDFWNTARLSGCKAVILPAKGDNHPVQLFTAFVPNLLEIHGVTDATVPQAPNIQKVIVVHRDPTDPKGSLLSSLQSEDCPSYCHSSAPGDLAVLFATSGSSGFCKLVPRSHEDVLKTGRSFEAAKSIIYFNDRTFGWMGGFPFDYLAHCAVRILQDHFDDQHAVTELDLWKVISREKCNGAALLPTQIASLMEEFKDKPPDFKLAFLVTGGQPLRQGLADTLGVLTQCLVVSYGSTEAGMVCVGVVKARDEAKDFFCGKPNKPFALKVVDETTGVAVEPGVRGSLLIKSALVFKGYYNQSQIPPKDLFTDDGWYKTGDLGSLDADGNLFCYSRAGDAVSQGSTIVYCSWPESVLCKCPDVVAVSVIRLPGSGPEGALCACVVARKDSGLDEEKLISSYKQLFIANEGEKKGFIPEISKVVFIDSLPLLASGKPNKRALASIVRDRLGITSD